MRTKRRWGHLGWTVFVGLALAHFLTCGTQVPIVQPLASSPPADPTPAASTIQPVAPAAPVSQQDKALTALVSAATSSDRETVVAFVRGRRYSCLTRPLREYAAGRMKRELLWEAYIVEEADPMTPIVIAAPRLDM